MQQQEKQQVYNPFPEEFQQVLRKFIYILQNKQRKLKSQLEPKKNEDEEHHFDTLLEQKENGSHFSLLSQNSDQTYISINFLDDDSRILQKILENLLLENQNQFSYYEKKQKGQSDLQNQQFSHVIVPDRKINSDVIQSNQQEDSTEEINVSISKIHSKSNKTITLNAKQLFNSLRKLKQKYEQYLEDLTGTKNLENKINRQSRLKEKSSKFKSKQKMMQADRIIFERCRQIIDESVQTFQQYDYEIQELNPSFKK